MLHGNIKEALTRGLFCSWTGKTWCCKDINSQVALVVKKKNLDLGKETFYSKGVEWKTIVVRKGVLLQAGYHS